MLAKIRHVAMYTHKHAAVDRFYRTVFGMRRMTSNTLDDTGKQNAERGHISDGVIGLAILSRYAGMQSGMDHYGFEVDDIEEYVRRMERYYPKTMIAKGLEYVPFAGLRSHDPAGTQFDIAQAHIANVREGYNESGWEQPRWINHIAIRADDPARVAEFYERIFGLKEAETYKDDGSIGMTDGKVKLLLRPRDKSLYRGLREGLDHMGFRVESLERAKDDLAAFAAVEGESGDGKYGVGGNGKKNSEDFQRCCWGRHFTADPDGVFIDMAEQ
jgi:catechol 2,3-dioxygenase-like lactoylglutathione lyase family enzyme